jgi:UrcA family protein
MLSRIVAFAASSFVGIVLGSIHAPAAPEFPERAVVYGDLDLATAEGARAVLVRIRRAARDVCRPETEDLLNVLQARPGVIDVRECQRKAVGDAVGRLDDQTVNASWSGQRPVMVARVDRPGG